MKKNSYKGAITVYLSIILPAVIMLSGVLMDIVRIKTAQVQVQRAANTAAASILAGFNTQLKNEYGIFALHNNNSDYLREEAECYLNSQLNPAYDNLHSKNQVVLHPLAIYSDNSYKDVNFIDLFDYRIENIEATPIYNFTENEITRQQIIEYMKYRAPAQFAENFMEKINYAASSREAASAYKQKTAIEKKLGKIEKSMKKLQKHIDQINQFEKRNFDNSAASGSQLIVYCRSMIMKEIYKTCGRANFGALETPEERAQVHVIQARIDQMYDEARTQSESSRASFEEQLSKCINAIYGARRELQNIERLSKQARQDMENLKAYLQELKQPTKSDEIDHSEIIVSMQKDVDKYEKLLDSENSKNIVETLNSNLEVFTYLQSSIPALGPWITSESRETSYKVLEQLESSFSTNVVDSYEVDALLGKLAADTKLKSMKAEAYRYVQIVNVLDKTRSKKGTDPRKKAAEEAKKVKEEVLGTDSSLKKIENPQMLPSYYANGGYPNKIFSEAVLGEQEGNQQLPRVVEVFDVDFDEDSSFVDDSLDYMIHFAEKLKDGILNTRNEIYVNEYILKVFKDMVDIDGSNTDSKVNGTFFKKGEVEYILCGNRDEKINNTLVKGQILLIRFGMNTLHVYSDPEKRLQALEAATAAAGITGFGIPIAHNLIMCAWGTAEALYDLQDIYAGKKVPFIKTADNWRTDLLPAGFEAKEAMQTEAGIMDFDYHDYLRLLLLAENKETKMNRIEDLIQLNLQQDTPEFKLSSSNTYVKLRVQVSIKYWFITKLFVPSKNKTGDGSRHVIDVEVWRGY